MPPPVIAVIASIIAGLPVFLVAVAFVAPFVLPHYFATFSKERLAKMRAAVVGGVDVLGPIATKSVNIIDDGVVNVLKVTVAAIDQVIARAELELGRKLKGKELVKARFIAESAIAKKASLASASASSIVKAVPKP